MKIFLLFFAFGLTPNYLCGQDGQWDWVVKAGGINSEFAKDVITDLNGNIYIIGNYNSPVVTFGSTTLMNKGSSDFFMIKFDPNGGLLWAQSFGGSGWDISSGITVDPKGNVIVTGAYNSPSLSIDGMVLTNKGSIDIFIAKFDPNGNVIWATSAGGSDFEGGNGIATDDGGNVYVTGLFFSPFLTFGTTTLIPVDDIDIFIAKYDTAGVPVWAKSYGGFGDEEGLEVAVDNAGNVILTGYFESPTIIFGSETLVQAGDRDIFICKHDSLGQIQWAKSYGGAESDIAVSVATDVSDNILVTGTFHSSSLVWDNVELTSGDGFSTNMYVVKLDTDGQILWGNTGKNNTWNDSRSVCTDNMGNVYVTGGYLSLITFDTLTLTGSNNYDVYCIKYDATGNVIWASSAGGSDGDDQGFGIAVDHNLNIYVTGIFESTICDFGAINLMNTGSSDLFLAKVTNGTSPLINMSWASPSIQLLPNPSITDILFQSEVLLVDAILRVYDTQGKIVTTIKGISGHQFVLPRHQIPGGIYHYQVIEDDKPLVTSTLVFE